MSGEGRKKNAKQLEKGQRGLFSFSGFSGNSVRVPLLTRRAVEADSLRD
ncbi:hypothetical protein LptCag_2497 [Leptospirillum ferriphilum]|uniref:Uncharacterized protein n=1 Tax=Leptospirillum ferriphilum TaxID=178606 RepID=A0A094WBZ7_9BACT|nr:hypothetical protein LptCag_2497 [Leptospirillum ferriphilum]